MSSTKKENILTVSDSFKSIICAPLPTPRTDLVKNSQRSFLTVFIQTRPVKAPSREYNKWNSAQIRKFIRNQSVCEAYYALSGWKWTKQTRCFFTSVYRRCLLAVTCQESVKKISGHVCCEHANRVIILFYAGFFEWATCARVKGR